MSTAADQANEFMVDRLIAEGALWSRPLIAAFRATPRHRFLDRIYQYHRKRDRWREVPLGDAAPAQIDIIYSDRALITHVSAPNGTSPGVPISSSSQPSLMAQMLEDLQLRPGQKVLEIGSGTGYNAALLAHVVQPGAVLSIDVDRQVVLEAWEHLRTFTDRVVTFKHADGRAGLAEQAPYDRIVATAATRDLEPAWLEELAPGGVLLAPLALAPGLAFMVRGSVSNCEFHGRLTRAAYFMPLRAEGEVGDSEESSNLQPPQMRVVEAPWAGWFERRRARGSWLEFIQALVFFGLIKGLAVRQESPPAGGEAVFGVSDGENICWLGANVWQVSGAAAHELGRALWHSFLDAGGPRPTEFLLRATPLDSTNVPHGRGVLRRGERCHQYWEQVEQIERTLPID